MTVDRPELVEDRRKRRPGREPVAELFCALGVPLVAALQRLHVLPPAVVAVHAALGLAAALAIVRGAPLAAAVLLQAKTLLDNADGQLARASGRVTVLGRYLDTELDLLVNAALYAALGHATGEPWLAAGAFVCLTLVLSADHNVAALHDEALGVRGDDDAPGASVPERALATIYAVLLGPHDRALRSASRRRLDAVLAGVEDPARRERAILAYHGGAGATLLANLGLSTQLLVLGLCLAVGVPEAYLGLVLGSAVVLPVAQLARERAARRALGAE